MSNICIRRIGLKPQWVQTEKEENKKTWRLFQLVPFGGEKYTRIQDTNPVSRGGCYSNYVEKASKRYLV